MERGELRSRLQDCGVICTGGIPMPVALKLDKQVKTIILNCAQYEPLLKVQTQLLAEYAQEILRTLSMIGSTVCAEQIIIALDEKEKEIIEIVESIAMDYPNLMVKQFNASYPVGDEVVFVYEVMGQIVGPNEKVSDLGIVVFNVETIYNVYQAVSFQKPVVEKIVSIRGEVKNPMTIKVPLGTRVDDLIKYVGGVTCEKPSYILGGPMWGTIGNSVSTITKSTDAVLVLPEEHCVVQKKTRKTSNELKRAAASCCQCMRCTDLCPRNLLGHPIEPHAFIRAASYQDFHNTDVFLNTMFCSTCGLCEMYSCIQDLSPRKLIAEYKLGLQANGVEKPQVLKQKIDEDREYRKITMERLTARLNLSKYDVNELIIEKTFPAKKVKIQLQQQSRSDVRLVVKTGDEIKEGQIIAKNTETVIHASICGVVCETNENFIIIETLGGRADYE